MGREDATFRKSSLVVYEDHIVRRLAAGKLRGHCPDQGRGEPIGAETNTKMMNAKRRT